MSDLTEESPVSQVIYDSTKTNSLMLCGTEITLANNTNNTGIKINTTGITINNVSSVTWNNIQSGSSILGQSNTFTQPNTFTTITATTINAEHLTVNQLPTTGNELVTKSYVDSLVGQYSGGLNLYLNYSTIDGSYNSLSNKINSNATQSINTQLVTNITYTTIASFITPSAYPGISVIPRGIWNMTVYGDVSSNSTGIVNYYFKVYRYISDSSSVLIATSTPSNDINSLTAYYMQATVPETSVNLTDRILINLDISSNGAPINTTIITYFENEYYSYIQTSLNDGTNILSAYNTWTGNNDFQAVGLKTASIDSNATALTIGGTTSSSLVLGKASNTTNIQGNLQIAGSSGSDGQVLKSNGTTTVWGDNWTGTATSNLSMDTYSINGNTIDASGILNIGTTTQTGINIGRTGYNTTITSLVASTTSISNINIIGSGTTGSLWSYSIAGLANILTSATRTGTTNMLTGSSQNTFNLGGAGGLTSNIYGVATNFLATANNFTNAIKVGSIDASANNLSIGTLTSTGLTLGKAATTTNIQGNLQIAGSAGTSGQVLTSAGSGSVPTWTTISGGGWTGTATGNLNMGTNAIGGTTTLKISTPIQPTGLTYGVNGTGNQYSIGYKNTLSLPAEFDLSQSNILLPIPNFNIQVTPGVWLVQGYIVCNSANTITTYNRISIVVGSGARGTTNSDITNDTHTNVVLNAASNQGNQISFNVISVFSTNITTYINFSVNANGPSSTVLLKFPITNYISVTRIA